MGFFFPLQGTGSASNGLICCPTGGRGVRQCAAYGSIYHQFQSSFIISLLFLTKKFYTRLVRNIRAGTDIFSARFYVKLVRLKVVLVV